MTNESIVDLRLWGKSRGLYREGEPVQCYPVVCHLLDTAAMMRALWREYVSPGVRVWIAEQLGVDEDHAGRLLELWAGLHDIGKITPEFQCQIPDVVPSEYPVDGKALSHDAAGHFWLGTALGWIGHEAGLAARIAEVVGGHHGIYGFISATNFTERNLPYQGLGSGPWEQQRRQTMHTIHEILGRPSAPPSQSAPAGAVICGLIILADWLASGAPYIKRRQPEVPIDGDLTALRAFFDGSVRAVPKVVADAGLHQLRLKDGEFAEEFPFAPNALQRSLAGKLPALAQGPGMLIITERMGQGKTEAALHAARIMGAAAGANGLYLALPTTATADQMFLRVKQYLQRRSAGEAPTSLLHSMAWLSPVQQIVADDNNADAPVASQHADMLTLVTEWLRGAKKAAFAPACVGTIDQALLSVLPVRHNALRMVSLIGKTVIIDEAHAYDPYMRKLLSLLLRWLGWLRVPVILMSATLPQTVAKDLAAAYLGLNRRKTAKLDIAIDYPGWAYIDRDTDTITPAKVNVAASEVKHLAVTQRPVTVDESGNIDRLLVLQGELSPLVTDGGCAAVICTTVAGAQDTYRALQAWAVEPPDPPELYLLHSRMPADQRERITNHIVDLFGKQRPANIKAIVVSTQVIEQSLDIDMDLIISDLAPVELLLQRAGRGHRHPSNDGKRQSWATEPRLVVLTAPGGDDPRIPNTWACVYPEAVLIRTQRLLARDAASGITIPSDIQNLVDTVYTDDSLITGRKRADLERRADDSIRAQEAKRVSIPPPGELAALAEMTDRDVDDEQVATRFDADSIRVLPCYEDDDGDRFLDPACRIRLPQPGRDDKFNRDQHVLVMEKTIPLRSSYLDGRTETHEPPKSWSKDTYFKRLVLLSQRVDASGAARPAQVGPWMFQLDVELGLVIKKS